MLAPALIIARVDAGRQEGYVCPKMQMQGTMSGVISVVISDYFPSAATDPVSVTILDLSVHNSDPIEKLL